jgi:hypothetical protein
MVYHGHPVFLWTTTDFTQGLHTKSEKKLTLSFNFMLHYADDVLSLKNSKIIVCLSYLSYWTGNKECKNTVSSSLFLDLCVVIDSEGRLRTKPDDDRNYFNFPIVDFQFIRAYISQLIRHSGSCGFPWQSVSANSKATEACSPSG